MPTIPQPTQPTTNPLAQPKPSQIDLLLAAASAPESPPELSKEEWDNWKNLPSKENNVYAGKENKNLLDMLKNNPEGFLVHKKNPNIRSLEGVDILSVPDDDMNLFVKPRAKPPLVS